MPTPDLHGELALVTGGAGFIGSHLVDGLLERGARVRVLDNLATGSAENLAHVRDRVEMREADIRDFGACLSACRDAAWVFHQAALGSVPRSLADPSTTVAVNVSGTTNVFMAARETHVRRVVYASSSSVYGDSSKLPKREGEEGRPLSPYALSKKMDEDLAEVFAACNGMELIGLRYFNVYGPRQDPEGPYAAVVPRFFQAGLSGEPAVIHGDGEQSRDFTFVADAVLANLLAAGAASNACGRSYNVGGGRRVTINEMAGLIAELTGSGRDPRHEAPRAGDVRHSLADVARAREMLGYGPAWDIRRGLEASLTHYTRRAADRLSAEA